MQRNKKWLDVKFNDRYSLLTISRLIPLFTYNRMKKLLYIFSIVLLASCSEENDPNPLGDSIHIYTEVLNKGQYDSEYGTENWEYMYLAWDEDESCNAYSTWVTWITTVNQLDYASWREIWWSSPGLNSDPDYLVFSDTYYDMTIDTTSISCQNNLGELQLIADPVQLINNGDYIINLN